MKDLEKEEFEERAMRWHQLSHPHVIELYGACHVGEPFIFVTEFSLNGSIRSFLRSDDNARLFLWQKMYEAALGLQYLHERSIVHGELRCENIFIGNNLAAKMSGFGKSSIAEVSNSSAAVRWKARELLEGQRTTFASDIYALGMCILEAVTDEAPWMTQSNLNAHVVRYVCLGIIPRRPRAMNDSQWVLVQTMCVSDDAKRMKVGYVVNALEKLAREECFLQHTEKHRACAFCRSRSHYSLAKRGDAMSDGDRVEGASSQIIETCYNATIDGSISDVLQRMRQKLAHNPDSQQMAKQVFIRLERVLVMLQQQRRSAKDAEVEKYCSILARFQQYLRTPFSDKSVARYVRSRKAADLNHVFHSEIDRLLNMLNVYDGSSMRDWRDEFDANVNEVQYHEGVDNSVDTGDERKHGGVMLMYFGASSSVILHPGSSAAISQPWYLPLQELVFTETDCIGEGSFGAVYRGVWLNTSVVVKFMGYKADPGKVSTQLLLHEVTIWRRLSHPHVVKLFGACHVDKRYFVREYASNGALSAYLKRSAPPTTASLTWQKLHEASLGLQYLHGQNVVHNDLKCDNILVSADGKAQLTDFGLSSIPNEVEVQIDVARMGAVHWKSPEYLKGDRPTFATDIYSFTMCILKVVTGDIPWGRQVAGVVVKYRVKNGQIPLFPDVMNEKQRKLVQLMTTSEPLKRVKIGFVVDKLLEITQDEAARSAP